MREDPFDPVDDSSTPLSPQEKRDLIPAQIATRAELNLAEQVNIAAATAWVTRYRRRDILNEPFIRSLHRRMLGDVWRWAGAFRLSERNIGIDHWEIPQAVRLLCDDAKAWIEHGAYSADEIAVRFHHRLVLIHPFANGNGRLARLMADVLIVRLDGEAFTWGARNLADSGDARKRYVAALRAADAHDLAPLVAFARS